MNRDISPKLFWQLFLPVLGIAITGILVLFYGFYTTTSKHHLNNTTSQLKKDALFIQNIITNSPNISDQYRLINTYHQNTNTRVTITNQQGEVIFDTNLNTSTLDNHQDRPEIKAALKIGVGSSIRFSQSIGETVLYFAIKTIHQDQVYVLRLSNKIIKIQDNIKLIIQEVFALILVIIILSLIFTIYLSKRITDPISSLVHIANEYAQENFVDIDTKSKFQEIKDLKVAMKKMAGLLQKRISDIYEESKEKKDILDNMTSGVLVLNSDGSIHTINPAAKIVLNLCGPDQEKTHYKDRIPHPSIIQIIDQFFQENQITETEIKVKRHKQSKHIWMTGSKNEDQIVLILQDITQIKNLEKTRQNFVANVSHELKTPITLILGSAETIIKDDSLSEKMKPFMDMILSHSQRMNAIIDDLLQLSQLESFNTLQNQFSKIQFNQVLRDSIATCQAKADLKKINIINVSSDYSSTISGHYDLIIQAISKMRETMRQ